MQASNSPERWEGGTRFAFLFVTLLIVALMPALAQEVTQVVSPYGWWFDIRAGAGEIDSEAGSSGGDSNGGWVLDFAGGLRIGEHWLVGIDLGGIGIQAYDLYDATTGESLDHVFLVTQYHPQLRGGWFVHAAGGWSNYTDSSWDWYEREGEGWGAELGFGFEWPVAERSVLAVLLRYEVGHIALDYPEIAAPASDYDYTAPKLSISWSYR